MTQALAAKSLTEGFGISLPMVTGSNLSAVFYQPVIAWPPGYTLLLTPIYLTTGNLKGSTFILEVFSTIFFYFIYFFLLKKLAFPYWIRSLLFLFSGFFLSQDVLYSSATDLLAVSFLLMALYYSLLVYEKSRTFIVNGLVLGLLCFLPAFFRHLYLPVVPVIPLILLGNALLRKNKNNITTAAIALSVILISCILLLSFLLNNKGFTGNISAPEPINSIHFDFLKYLHPFIFSSFINIDFAALQISAVTGIKYIDIRLFILAIHFPLLVAIILYFLSLLLKNKFRLYTTWDVFFSTSFLISTIIVSCLSLLTIISPLMRGWTYIQEERYFKFIAVCLPVIFFYYFHSNRNKEINRFKKFFHYGIILLICLDVLRGFYFINEDVLPLKNYKPSILCKTGLTWRLLLIKTKHLVQMLLPAQTNF
ncbi:MAG TPA: hypothetical protein VM888_06645, partial [Chitinophagaceae bacterium]|nr:hypothetical protein [Chitinophagaceae bacterium]